MKKITVLIFAAFMLIGFTANAHVKKSAEERAEKLTKEMVAKLSLDASQEQKIAAINLNYAKKNDELMTAKKDDKAAMRKSFKEQQENKEKELKEVFTDEQFKLWKETKTEKKDEFKKKGEGKKKRADFKQKRLTKAEKAN